MPCQLKFVTLSLILTLLWSAITASPSLAQRRKQMAIAGETTAAESAKKFVELLETKDFTNFRGYKTEEIPEGWEIQGKNLVFSGKGDGDVITKESYKDFELQVEWSIEKGGNSGIMFRVTLGDDQTYQSGPEFQIFDDTAASDANELHKSGALYDLYPAEEEKFIGPDKWNKSRIVVEGNKITHYLNGVKVVEAMSGSDDWNERLAKSKFKDWEKFNKSEEGHIAFQNHGNAVKFRNIRIKRLDDSVSANSDPSVSAADGSTAPQGAQSDSELSAAKGSAKDK